MRTKGTVVTKTPQTLLFAAKTTAGVGPVEISSINGVVLTEEKK
jgi:hypothetical protein